MPTNGRRTTSFHFFRKIKSKTIESIRKPPTQPSKQPTRSKWAVCGPTDDRRSAVNFLAFLHPNKAGEVLHGWWGDAECAKWNKSQMTGRRSVPPWLVLPVDAWFYPFDLLLPPCHTMGLEPNGWTGLCKKKTWQQEMGYNCFLYHFSICNPGHVLRDWLLQFRPAGGMGD